MPNSIAVPSIANHLVPCRRHCIYVRCGNDRDVESIGYAIRITELATVYRADRPNVKVVLDPASSVNSLDYFYQLRSNITHRGKSSWQDSRT